RYAFLRSAQASDLPPILFLHGFGASIGHWRQNLPFFAQHHTVYALDLLGFGASEKAPIPYTVDLWVQQVRTFWQTFIRRPMMVVGNSIGSLVALTAAHQYPEMVQGLAMLSLPDPSVREDLIPPWCRPWVSGLERALTGQWILKPLFYWVRRPQVIRPWVSIAYARREAVTDELVELLAAPARDRGAALAFSHLLQGMIHPRFGPRVSTLLPDLQIPILLIWGRQDRMVPPAFGQIFAPLNPKLQLIELDPAGHCPHDECAQDVNQILDDWIQRNIAQMG
ncbi:MAG: alpha/beta fold hydrolase, partial [Thermosynechococcaceae cyanobacterium]